MPDYLYIRTQNETNIKHGTERTDQRLLEKAEKRIALYSGIHRHLGLDTDSAPHRHDDRTEESIYILLLCGAVPFSMDVFKMAEDRF